jgi:CRISPR-associated protein Cst1
MTATAPPASSLRLSGHPIQRCGALALAELAGRDRPEDLDAGDLQSAAERIAGDVAFAATASPGQSGYDWWKVLFALYPNSKPTHAKRERDRTAMRAEMHKLLGPDQGRGTVRPCVFCDQECTVLWSKSTLPMFDSVRAINVLPPRSLGWPVCRGCRMAAWALPYGAWLTAGSATVLTCADGRVERAFVARNVKRADRIRQLGFASLAAGVGPEAVALRALREHALASPAPATLWMFKNDNQEPWLRVTSTRGGASPFLARMLTMPPCRRAWSDLRRAMHRTDASGRTVLSGATAAARMLFDPELAPRDRLVSELFRRSTDLDTLTPQQIDDRRTLLAVYLEVMHAMDTTRLQPLAHMLADWITAESSRGRFNEYRRASGSAYPLHKLLMTASARLYLNGAQPVDAAETIDDLLAAGTQGWRLRAALWFQVLAELKRRELALADGQADEPSEDEQADPDFDGPDPLSDDDNDEDFT